MMGDRGSAVLETIAALVRSALEGNSTGSTARVARTDLLPALIRAKQIYALRRRRDRVFGSYTELFADPAWDLLLDLFISEHEGRLISVSSACVATCVPPTTALRWVATMERRELVKRLPDYKDRRRSFLKLTDLGRILVENVLIETES